MQCPVGPGGGWRSSASKSRVVARGARSPGVRSSEVSVRKVGFPEVKSWRVKFGLLSAEEGSFRQPYNSRSTIDQSTDGLQNACPNGPDHPDYPDHPDRFHRARLVRCGDHALLFRDRDSPGSARHASSRLAPPGLLKRLRGNGTMVIRVVGESLVRSRCCGRLVPDRAAHRCGAPDRHTLLFFLLFHDRDEH